MNSYDAHKLLTVFPNETLLLVFGMIDVCVSRLFLKTSLNFLFVIQVT